MEGRVGEKNDRKLSNVRPGAVEMVRSGGRNPETQGIVRTSTPLNLANHFLKSLLNSAVRNGVYEYDIATCQLKLSHDYKICRKPAYRRAPGR